MKQFYHLKRACAWVFCLAISALVFTGCESLAPDGPKSENGNPEANTQTTSDMALSPGDLITISFSGVPMPPEKYEGRIKEDGHISLSYLTNEVSAVGKTTAELQKAIQDLYVPRLYKQLTVNVNTENRWFFVDGEVRTPNRLIYSGKISVLGAIASAGGFTDFANKRRVQLIRGKDGTSIVQDCYKAKKKPELDMTVFPGDKIIVPRRLY